MPTLEDTVDFKVATLNDLLDADVRTGVPVAADDKYKRWAFLSTGLAGMLLVALIVAVLTGGGDDGGGGVTATKSVDPPPNTQPIDVSVGTSVPTGVEPGAAVSLLDSNGQVVASGATVTQVKQVEGALGGKAKTNIVVVAVSNDDLADVTAARVGGGKLALQAGTLPKATTTTTAVPSTTPTPIEPAPATPPPS
jgi:hypothetical protein